LQVPAEKLSEGFVKRDLLKQGWYTCPAGNRVRHVHAFSWLPLHSTGLNIFQFPQLLWEYFRDCPVLDIGETVSASTLPPVKYWAAK
jgi:hypothetical protein